VSNRRHDFHEREKNFTAVRRQRIPFGFWGSRALGVSACGLLALVTGAVRPAWRLLRILAGLAGRFCRCFWAEERFERSRARAVRSFMLSL
jgi:hypothetical protein